MPVKKGDECDYQSRKQFAEEVYHGIADRVGALVIHKSALVAIHKGDFKVFDRADVDNDGNLELDEWHDFLETAAAEKGDRWLMNMLSTFKKNLELGVLDPRSIHGAMKDECEILWRKLRALSALQAVDVGKPVPKGVASETLMAVVVDSEANVDADLFRSKLGHEVITLEEWQSFLDTHYHTEADPIQANLQLKGVLLNVKNSPSLDVSLVKSSEEAIKVKKLSADLFELQKVTSLDLSAASWHY